jgi:hypothetical protein
MKTTTKREGGLPTVITIIRHQGMVRDERYFQVQRLKAPTLQQPTSQLVLLHGLSLSGTVTRPHEPDLEW